MVVTGAIDHADICLDTEYRQRTQIGKKNTLVVPRKGQKLDHKGFAYRVDHYAVYDPMTGFRKECPRPQQTVTIDAHAIGTGKGKGVGE